MAGYRKPKPKVRSSKPEARAQNIPQPGAQSMPIGEGPMNNAAGKVGKMGRLVAGLKKLRGRRTSMAAGKGTDLPTTGGY
jgi:hypothetical protein